MWYVWRESNFLTSEGCEKSVFDLNLLLFLFFYFLWLVKVQALPGGISILCGVWCLGFVAHRPLCPLYTYNTNKALDSKF